MISDFVKGKKQYDYPASIQQGIRLHRLIDELTDDHPATKEVKKFFSPVYRLYSAAFADVVYDYFLANDTAEFKSEAELFQFSQDTYAILSQNLGWLGDGFGAMFPYMQQQNWLYNYRLESGMQKSFNGLKNRSRYIKEVTTAFDIFQTHKKDIQQLYNLVFPDVKKACKMFSGKP